jgi:photosystem II stability/assembly factor-like uncharacterized protein
LPTARKFTACELDPGQSLLGAWPTTDASASKCLSTALHSGCCFTPAVACLFAAIGMICVPASLAQDKPSLQAKPPQATSYSPPLKNSPGSLVRASDRDAAAKIQVPSVDSAENDGDQQFDKDEDGPDQIRKRDEWFYRQRSSVNGHIPAGARLKAFQQMQRMMEAEGKLARRPDGSYSAVAPEAAVTPQGALTPAWMPIGPTPTTGGTFSPVTGRITTIAADPSDTTGNTVLIGGAQGGIWRSTDAGQTWTAVGDQNPSLAMGSIAFAPSNPMTVYAGTGEQAFIAFDIYYGAGVLKSTDGGLHWTQTCTLASATCPFIGPYTDSLHPGFGFFNFGGAHISYVAVNPANPNMVLVGAQFILEGPQEGVYCSDNGGQTWTNILPDEMSTFVGFASSGVAYAAFGNSFGSLPGAPNGNGIYKATGIGSACPSIHFVRLTAPSLPAQSNMGRIDLGIAPSDAAGNIVYASIANASTVSATNLGVFVTTNGGASWTQTSAPDVCKRQCWYDSVVKVDPAHANIAYFGGSAVTSGGNPNWVVRTTDTGNTWSTVIPNALGPGLPHVDSHAIAFAKLSNGTVRMYLGNDGGIWRTDDAEAPTVTWTNLNNSSLTLSQFYPSLSIHPSNPAITYGGTQDNSSQQLAGAPIWGVSTTTINTTSGPVVRQACGDGGQTAIDTQVPSTVYISCQGISVRASYLDGSTGSFFPAIDGINRADHVNFIPPLATDPNTANVIYFGTTKVYQSQDAGNSWAIIQQDLVNGLNGEVLTAIAVAPTNSKVLYVGANTGQVFDTIDVNSGNGLFTVAGQGSLPPRAITAIAVDPFDTSGLTAYVAYSGFAFVGDFLGNSVNDPLGHLFKTTDRGNTWTDLSCSVADCSTPAAADLPNIPVNDIVVDPDVPGTIYAATDLGVYVANCTAAPCTWNTLGTGLPRVAVLSLRLHRASRTLRAATHGRGAWDIILNNFTVSGPHISSLTPTSASSGGNSFTLAVNGTGLAGGTIEWNGSTTGVTMLTGGTDTTLTATIAASLLTAGAANITVKTPGGATSNGLPFGVLSLTPTLTSINPASTPVQKPNPTTNVQIQLTGANFAGTGKVMFNGAPNGITTTFNSGTSLTATLPAALLGPYGSTNDVTVLNKPPGGGKSQPVIFKVVAPAPPNDNFANAINITSLSFLDVEDSSSATTEASDPLPACAQQFSSTTGNTGGQPNGLYNTIWYKFTPAFSAFLEVDTIGSSYDTVLSIWTGSGGSLTGLACNDDIQQGVVIQSQLTSVPLTAGTTYYFMVSSFGPPDPNPIALGGRTIFSFSYNGGVNPPATITTLSPTSVPSGNPAFTLTINGSGFLNGAIVYFSGNPETTTVVNPTQLTAAIQASDVILPGTFGVQVNNPGPGGGAFNNLNFNVTVGVYPVPTLTSLSPTGVIAGEGPVPLTASGTNFASNASLTFNGVLEANPSIFGSKTIYVTIAATDVATPGTVQVTVTNPTPGGGSASLPFTIAMGNPTPTITSIVPNTATIGSQINVTINGTNFQQGAVAIFNNIYLSTNFVSSTQLTSSLVGLLNSPGTYSIVVRDPPPGGQSSAVNFTVPTPDFTLTAQGTTTQTVAAGQTATFTNAVSVSALNGFTSAVNLSCSLPAAATSCSVNPALLASGSGSATVTVTTMARGLVPPTSPNLPFTLWPILLPAIFFAILLCALFTCSARTRAQRLAAALPLTIIVVFLILQAVGCGGGGGGSPPPPPPPTGTQIGTYTITVTGTSTTTRTTTLQLTVN